MKKTSEFYVVCDNIRSALNVGSIFRTADALGVGKIFLAGISPTPENQKVKKTALGAEKNIPWEHSWQVWRLADKLKEQKITLVALEQPKELKKAGINKKAVLYNKFKPKFPMALVLGNEINGVSRSVIKKADKIVYLPMSGEKESLNVAVAFGAVGYGALSNL